MNKCVIKSACSCSVCCICAVLGSRHRQGFLSLSSVGGSELLGQYSVNHPGADFSALLERAWHETEGISQLYLFSSKCSVLDPCPAKFGLKHSVSPSLVTRSRYVWKELLCFEIKTRPEIQPLALTNFRKNVNYSVSKKPGPGIPPFCCHPKLDVLRFKHLLKIGTTFSAGPVFQTEARCLLTDNASRWQRCSHLEVVRTRSEVRSPFKAVNTYVHEQKPFLGVWIWHFLKYCSA